MQPEKTYRLLEGHGTLVTRLIMGFWGLGGRVGSQNLFCFIGFKAV